MVLPERSDTRPKPQGGFKDKDIQSVIGWILRGGVIISMLIVFSGGIIYLIRHGQEMENYSVFKGTPAFIHTGRGIINGIFTGRGQAIIQAGIILLIATPIIRVVFSAIGFLIEKDYLYTIITFIVLCIIFFSMFSGHIG